MPITRIFIIISVYRTHIEESTEIERNIFNKVEIKLKPLKVIMEGSKLGKENLIRLVPAPRVCGASFQR